MRKTMIYETVEARNYDLDLVIAESKGIAIDQVDELPLGMVELLRKDIISKSPNQWGFQGDLDYIYEKSCDDSDCLCRNDFSWPDNIKDGCSKREGVLR